MGIKLNILTRTSKRPNFFRDCKKSIELQTYSNIRHIVCYDSNSCLDYIPKKDVFHVKKLKEPTLEIIEPPLKFAPYNLYLNTLNEKVKEGYIMYLDDDDVFDHSYSVDRIMQNITSEDNLILWRVKFPHSLIPEDEYFGKKPELYHVSMIGFAYHHKYSKLVKFDEMSCGDYRYVTKLWDIIPNKIWINEELTKIQRGSGWGGRGHRDDKGENDYIVFDGKEMK